MTETKHNARLRDGFYAFAKSSGAAPARTRMGIDGVVTFTWFVSDDSDVFVEVRTPVRAGGFYLVVWREGQAGAGATLVADDYDVLLAAVRGKLGEMARSSR